MRRKKTILLLILSFVCTINLNAQNDDPSMLNLDRIYSSREFSTQRITDIKWLNEGNKYTMLEASESVPGHEDIVSYDVATGEREVVVSADKLIPEGWTKPLAIDDYELYTSHNKLLIFTNSARVWRRNTRGDYWVVDLNTWRISQIGKGFEESRLMFATFSPDFSKIAYVYKNNLYAETLADHKILPLTTDGSETIINGTFDWVYEEELGLRNGFRWSPDGSKIAYWQLDAEGVGIFYLINNTDSLYSQVIPVQYPKVGTTNSAAKVGVVNADGGATTWFKIPGDPRNNYIARMEWADNSDEVIVQHLNRLQNTCQVILGNAGTGDINVIHIEKDDAWLRVVDDLKWFNNGAEFTWISETDGWRHVYIVSRDGKKIKGITPWDFDVISVELIDDTNGWLYFMASPNDAAQRYLYYSKLDGSGKAERLSPADQSGTHRYNISPNGKFAFHTFSNANTPPVTQLVNLPAHETVRVLVDNAKLKENYDKLKIKPVEFFRITIEDGTVLDGFKILPYNFNPAKKYPVLFYVYGEPAGQTVLDSWGRGGNLWYHMLAQQGYIIISVDNRGTPAPRGREWRKCVYRQIGILASADQAAAVREISKWPYVDSDRIGIWGWSGGGSMTLNAMFRYPDLYKTGISVAPVPDQKLYDSIYQERYMGLPNDNEEGYRLGSPITFASQLKGNLMIIHGTGDDNVHFQGTERLINELVKYNKMFTMMAYPNRSHSIYEGPGTTRHLYETMTRYLKTNLPPGPVDK